jgi:DUF4097 and DUF4098 domain-containing protein YvlB
MRPRIALIITMSVVLLLALSGCSRARSDEQSYEVTEQIRSLVIEARAAAVTVEAGNGPVRVTETYRYTNDRPGTSHQVSGTALRLTESGCPTDELRCSVEFSVRVPAATAVEITTQAGAVSLVDLTGDVMIITDAGAVEGKGLGGDSVSVKTQAGATSLEFTEPPATVEASTELGAISVKVPGGTAYAVDASTEAGGSDVSVQQDPSSPHKLSLRTRVGGIRVENV